MCREVLGWCSWLSHIVNTDEVVGSSPALSTPFSIADPFKRLSPIFLNVDLYFLYLNTLELILSLINTRRKSALTIDSALFLRRGRKNIFGLT